MHGSSDSSILTIKIANLNIFFGHLSIKIFHKSLHMSFTHLNVCCLDFSLTSSRVASLFLR